VNWQITNHYQVILIQLFLLNFPAKLNLSFNLNELLAVKVYEMVSMRREFNGFALSSAVCL